MRHDNSFINIRPLGPYITVRGVIEEAEYLIKEAKTFLNAAWNTADDKRYELFISWAREIIEPLANSN